MNFCGQDAEAAKWESLFDACEDALIGEQIRDNYGHGESIADCARRVLAERDRLHAALTNLLATVNGEGGTQSDAFQIALAALQIRQTA